MPPSTTSYMNQRQLNPAVGGTLFTDHMKFQKEYNFKNVIEMADNCPVLLKLLHNLIAKFVVVILVVPRSVLTTPPDKVFPKGDILDQIKDQRPA